ncbi:MAG: carboxylesterase family protein [Flavobacteriales bacterium]|nr:carboxylesterase family protein [Flavobacteriales bacterium]
MIKAQHCWPLLVLLSFCSNADLRPAPSTVAQVGRIGVVKSTHVYRHIGNDTLLLDLRIPSAVSANAPGVVFVHGGGFSQGMRDRGAHTILLDSLATQGIASASISYRLTMKGKGFGCDVPSNEKQDAVEAAAEDLMSALDWLGTAPAALNLPEDWVAMGSSAGAETAMWAGYGEHPDAWLGVVAFSGAITDTLTLPKNPPPFFAVHGRCDDVVPPNRNLHRSCRESDAGGWWLCGGLCWAERIMDAGGQATTREYCQGDHMVCNSAMLDPVLRLDLIRWLTEMGREQNIQQAFQSSEGRFLPGPCPDPCQ